MPPSPSPRETLIVSIRNNDIQSLCTAIETLRHSRRGFDSAEALSLAVREARPDVVRYLLERENATVKGLEPARVSACAAVRDKERGLDSSSSQEEDLISVWAILMENGWDVNARGSGDIPHSNGDRLLTQVCHNEDLVSYLLRHGATAADPPDLDSFSTPPILERVAQVGSVKTFRILMAHGAQLSTRVLHRAVESAAYSDKEGWKERMEMVRVLVEEEGCDVNAMDVGEGQRLPNHWGTPAAYGLHAPREGGDWEGQVVELVGYLLEKGADPTIKDCWGTTSVLDRAERVGNQKILDMLQKKSKERTGSRVRKNNWQRVQFV